MFPAIACALLVLFNLSLFFLASPGMAQYWWLEEGFICCSSKASLRF
jgi:hypothetical protein